MLKIFPSMTTLELLQGPLKPLADKAAQQWGMAIFVPALLQNPDFCDLLLLWANPEFPLSDAWRKELYAALIGPGPGGLLAFGWLLQKEHLDSALVQGYLDCLQTGAARPDALSEEAVTTVLDALLEFWGRTEEEGLGGICRLLNSDALTSRARVAAMSRLVRESALPWRSRLAHWACRANRNDADLPSAHPELHKAGFLQCVQLGEPPSQVLAEAVRQSEDTQVHRRLRESAAQAAVELLESFPAEVPPALARTTLLHLKDSATSGLRRRAFQLLEKQDPETGWVHRALRDRDAGVRSWALQQMNRSASA